MASILPEIILKASEAAVAQFLPVKSSDRYLNAYSKFINWRKEQNTESFEEEVLLVYFDEASKRYKPSALWSMYSMLKGTIISKHNIDIGRYPRLIAFLKQKNLGFKSKQAAVFTPEEIKTFLLTAPDSEFLAVKAVTVFGISGGCPGDEITHVKIEHVIDNGKEIIVRIPDSKNYESKVFPITSETSINIVRRYVGMRPVQSSTNRFFILQLGERCCSQPIGKNTIASMPQRIARFLKFEKPEDYTGHSFRRTSTTIAADAGASLESQKRFYYWKSNTVPERYIKDSVGQKRPMSEAMTKALDSEEGGEDTNEPNVKIVKICSGGTTDVEVINNTEGGSLPTVDSFSDIDEKDNADGVVLDLDSNNDDTENNNIAWNQDSIGENMSSNACKTIALSQSVSNNEKIERHSLKIENCKYFTIKFGNCSK